ncbi:MAG: tRNA (adenosine(37)-N6)-threonylcarbamoyltransferase complex dimerization subunit type 1 TsaB [Burkholderiales bacterium]|jgi:tRNA threonylcarbamoyladenosine biosynthesis protein TsaB|nr:tRNA (adenosine(37)-N6)-threonylcarbamoyltransferase complex dimerization subunit type 1 TsaB [Burkholderiales bacterium]MBP7519005.1 tRNA (adenosine(37)-N6)-threonylcarbamoyltransferase complex dimerization subunit type 1 TsaB [Leptothrix sp. (in: b-proteobacteria)]HQY08719.1 tRNA (adenosine(37)-N6)-threonylcarbamoyltransferase complex dimerization subunit type 1 TsaB [Burkholderiaceae bacterium]
MSAPRLLAIDAATDTVHLGLWCSSGVHTRALPGGAQASAQLLPMIRNLLDEAGLRLAELQAVAFGRGPGAFTGLRTACSVAQGLAVGIGCPVLALDTLAAVAQSAARRAQLDRPGTRICSATDARMGEVYAACWERDAQGGWTALEPPALLKPPALRTLLNRHGGLAAGNAWALPAVRDEGAPDAACDPDAVPDGQALAALARVEWRAARTLDPALALPLYVRDKVAQTTAEREAARTAAAAA